MFRAVITSDDGGGQPAFQFSGEVSPYDLSILREHVLRRRGERGVLQVVLRTARGQRPRILQWLGDLARYGVNVTFLRD
jgi:hypothetical protein